MLEMTLLDKEQMVSHKRSTTLSKVAKTSFRNPRLRISFQICSMGFISGVYGGMGKRIMFSGNSNPPDLCHAAPSQQSNIMLSEYCSDNFFRKIFIQTALLFLRPKGKRLRGMIPDRNNIRGKRQLRIAPAGTVCACGNRMGTKKEDSTLSCLPFWSG